MDWEKSCIYGLKIIYFLIVSAHSVVSSLFIYLFDLSNQHKINDYFNWSFIQLTLLYILVQLHFRPPFLEPRTTVTL